MRKTSSISSARRNSEALLKQSQKREANFKWEQEREYQAMVSNMAHLREQRLAQEAADKAEALITISRPTRRQRGKK
jgi:hypothetical protein